MLISLSVVSFSQINEEQVNSVNADLGFSTGPDVGQIVPMFTLPDQNGTMMSLKELVGENGAILNFFRSASW